MSRGYQKTSGFSARETTEEVQERAAQTFYKSTQEQRDAAVRDILADRENYYNLSELVEAVSIQQTDSTGKNSGSLGSKAALKANKLKIVELLQMLPASVRKAIEVPREAINGLYRGVSDRKITETDTWKNGSFVYGFTPKKFLASGYAAALNGKVIGADDIESFDGIISIANLYKLAGDYNKAAWGDDKTFLNSMGAPLHPEGLKKAKPSEVEAYTKKYNDFFIHPQRKAGIKNSYNGYPSEHEHIVYGIKYKKSGDNFYSDK